MTEIRYYRSGSDEPVRVAQRKAAPAHAVRYRGRRVLVLVAVLLVITAAALAALIGRQAFADAFASLAVLDHVRRLPHWSGDAALALAAGVAVLGTCALAFGRRRIVVIACVALLVGLFAAPGVALGWASAFVGQMGRAGTAEQRSTVAGARSVLQRPLPDRPVNILLLGIDHAGPGDPGRSDSQILVRLDPQSRTISMLSLPRDLRWDVPGLGYTKMNAAYTYGGVKLAVKTFSDITGLPINHFVRVDFSGFWRIVDILHGVYLPVDHFYYNTEGNGFQPIDIQPGYQLLKAKDALRFVRYRHDQQGDFTRIVRQQLFLREVQRQATRWSGSWTTVIKMVRTISGLTTTDMDSLNTLLPIVNLAMSLNTSHIYQVHVQGSTPTIAGVSYVVATSGQIAQAVQQFEHPPQPHRASVAAASPQASPAASGSASSAGPGGSGAAASSGGSTTARATAANVYDFSGWQALAGRTSLTLEAPTAWAPGLGWDTGGVPFRAYNIKTPSGNRAAAIAVGTVGGPMGTEYWGIQALHWNDPPAIADPSSTRTVAGRTYKLYYQDAALHMVAWRQNGDTYWVINTLDNLLSDKLMMTLATSCAPLRP
jgi:polyisoprenyl-teichoic acid--peptidoglycan teichoic acid transferase